MMWGYGMNMGWMWPLGLLLCVFGGLALLALVWVVVGGIKRNEARGAALGTTVRSTPRQILDERYAQGELTTEEYRERIKTLSGTE